MSEIKASIFDIYHGTSHDGPGIRSTVFFSGCPLSCRWCHNPEGISLENRIWWESLKCIGCEICQESCQANAISLTDSGVFIKDDVCVKCGVCVKNCPSKALSFVSKEVSLGEIGKELIRHKPYYKNTGGGVTASGGECLLQADFVKELFIKMHENEVNTALDTSGFISFKEIEKVLPHTDVILYDIKLMDKSQHIEYTGQNNDIILENLIKISKMIDENKLSAKLWIRTPLIPKSTAELKNIHNIAGFIASSLKNTVSRWELCAFNNSCIKKYEKLGVRWEYQETGLINACEAEAIKKATVKSGLASDNIIFTGIFKES